VRRPTGTPVRVRLAGRGTEPGLLGGKTASLQLEAGISDSCAVNEDVEHRSCAQHGQPGTAKEAVPSFRPCICPPQDGRGNEGCIFTGAHLFGVPLKPAGQVRSGVLSRAPMLLSGSLSSSYSQNQREVRCSLPQSSQNVGTQNEAAAAASAQMTAAPGVCPASHS
jgi:hypothetical protein